MSFVFVCVYVPVRVHVCVYTAMKVNQIRWSILGVIYSRGGLFPARTFGSLDVVRTYVFGLLSVPGTKP